MNWQDAIQELLALKKTSLRQLAIEFGMGVVFVAEVAGGSCPASPMIKFRILTALWRPLGRDELILLLRDKVADEIRRIDAGARPLA